MRQPQILHFDERADIFKEQRTRLYGLKWTACPAQCACARFFLLLITISMPQVFHVQLNQLPFNWNALYNTRLTLPQWVRCTNKFIINGSGLNISVSIVFMRSGKTITAGYYSRYLEQGLGKSFLVQLMKLLLSQCSPPYLPINLAEMIIPFVRISYHVKNRSKTFLVVQDRQFSSSKITIQVWITALASFLSTEAWDEDYYFGMVWITGSEPLSMT